MTGDGTPKVTDFGIARSLAVGEGMTETGTVLGSADYIAPEQAQGLAVDESCDVYSLGVVLYELLTGELPFSGDSFVAVAMKHVTEPGPYVRARRPSLPRRIDAVVATALEKDPADWFPTMARFERELEACREEVSNRGRTTFSTLVIPPAVSAGREPGARGRAAAAAALLAATVAAVAAALVVLATGRGGPRPTPVRAASEENVQSRPVALHAIAAFDPPPGDGVEDDSRLPLATDGNPATSWATEWYASSHFGNVKQGVGIVLDAGKPVQLNTLAVRTDTPGFSAVIEAGRTATGPFTPVSRPAIVRWKTTFSMRSSARARYLRDLDHEPVSEDRAALRCRHLGGDGDKLVVIPAPPPAVRARRTRGQAGARPAAAHTVPRRSSASALRAVRDAGRGMLARPTTRPASASRVRSSRSSCRSRHGMHHRGRCRDRTRVSS